MLPLYMYATRDQYIALYSHVTQPKIRDPSATITRAEAAASASAPKSGSGMTPSARFHEGVVSLIQVLCDQMSWMAFEVP